MKRKYEMQNKMYKTNKILLFEIKNFTSKWFDSLNLLNDKKEKKNKRI